MILGSIQAPGSVYVINPNGVIFGPTAQINVHSLIASSLDVGNPTMSTAERNSFFLNTGILGNGSSVPAESFSYNQNDRQIEGDVIVEAGAQITASLAPRSVSPDAGGFVYLFAPNVENRGTITTPAGETLMVAAQAVQLIANAYPDGNTADPAGTFRAVGVNTTISALNNGQQLSAPIIWRLDGPASAQISAPGRVTNSGLINAERGVVILNGDLVTNESLPGGGPGVIQANTSITRNGQIYLDGRLQVRLAGGSLQILPSENGETIPDSALNNFSPGLVEMRGDIVDLEPGALIEAPGANVSIFAQQPVSSFGIYPDATAQTIETFKELPPRFFMASGSAIDVSGLQDVSRPMSDNFLTFKPFGNEFADQPLQRNGALRGQELTVDLRQSGALNGVNWIGTPLANLSGFATSVARNIDQLLTTGGNVTLNPPLSNAQIVTAQGSSINVGGGTVQYAGAALSASKLLTADGRIVSISNASPLDTYIGVAGVSTLEHPHWGDTTTQTFIAPLLSGAAAEEPGYTEGHDAGAITMNASAYSLGGDLYGGVTAGERQRALGQRPASGDNALAMPQAGSLSLAGVNNLTVAADTAPLAGNFGPTTALPDEMLQTTTLSAAKLSNAGFGSVTANFSGHLTLNADATLTVAPGGSINLSGGGADIEGSLVAHSGLITVDSRASLAGGKPVIVTTPQRSDLFDLVIGSAAHLDVSGLWVNDSGADPASLIGGAYIDGGSIALKTEARSVTCATSACTSVPGLGARVLAIVDLTGDLVLNQGALLNAFSGGRVTDRGIVMLDSKGRAAGKGGNIALATYVGSFSLGGAPFPPTVSDLVATIRLAGSDGSADGNAAVLAQALRAFGFSQGGTLSLQAPAFDIGGGEVPGSFLLPASFFNGNGFGAYSFNSVAGHIAIAPGTTLVLRQRNFVPTSSLATLPTGTDIAQILALDYLPDFLRQPVNLSLTSKLPFIPAAPYDPSAPVPPKTVLSVGEGAAIEGDPGASISLDVAGQSDWVGTNNGFRSSIAEQLANADILGSISAPGGTIALTSDQFAQLWLGADSRLDVSGVALTDTRQTLFRTGTVLPGGTVTITALDAASSVIGLHGAVIDVSGASGEYDLLANAQPTTAGQQRVATQIWSDAGSITLSSPTLLYDGAFLAQPGASTGNGGSLTINAPQDATSVITVRQNGDAVPDGLNPNDSLGALAGTAVFLADRLEDSGIQNSVLHHGACRRRCGQHPPGQIRPRHLVF